MDDVPGISLLFFVGTKSCGLFWGEWFQFCSEMGSVFLNKDLFKNCRCLEFPGDQVGDRDLFSLRF